MFQQFHLGNNSHLKWQLSLGCLRHYSSCNLLNRIAEPLIATYYVTLPLWLNVKHPSQHKVLNRPVKGRNFRGSNCSNYPSHLFKVSDSSFKFLFLLVALQSYCSQRWRLWETALFCPDSMVSACDNLTRSMMLFIYTSVSGKGAGWRTLADNTGVHLLSGPTLPFCAVITLHLSTLEKNRLFLLILFPLCWL